MPRPLPVIASLAFAFVASIGACGHTLVVHSIEQIGGGERARGFASGTGYEAYLRAEIALARGDLTQAGRQLELAEIAEPSDGYLPARRAEVLLLAQSVAEARTVATEATQRFPEQAATWIALAEVQLAANDPPGASRALTRALATAPDDPEVRGAVARLQGASSSTVASAIEGAPGARPGDRTVARRLALDAWRDDRPTLRTVRRARAERAMAQHAWREVDALLTPLVLADPTDVVDRVRVVEARARDGRPREAAPWVAGVPIGASGVRRAEHARLWWLAGRADLAAEEALGALHEDPSDLLALRVAGEALVHTGAVAHGLELLGAIPPASLAFVDAQLVAAAALSRADRAAVADTLLQRAMMVVPHEETLGRDRLRLARASERIARGQIAEAQGVLADVETPIGRQRRGALLAMHVPPDGALADLRVRSHEPWDDALADAWIVLLCARHPTLCTDEERTRALASATAGAPEAPETLRARASVSVDRREAADLLHAAVSRDPLSPWNPILLAQIAARSRP